MLGLSPAVLLQTIVIVVVSLTIHEFAHAGAALWLGDTTPRREGRLTLNPLRHIDVVGFILLVVAGFGWAKPVHIDTTRLRNPRRDEILIALAGPLANLAAALLAALALKIALAAFASSSVAVRVDAFNLLTRFAVINISLAVFNLLPIPPLDGSHLITGLLSKSNAALAAAIFRYGAFALLAVVLIQTVTQIQILPIAAVTRAVVAWIYRGVGILSI
jgi:Zn-dependent protease